MPMNQIFTIDIATMLALQWILHRTHFAFQPLTDPSLLQKKHRFSRTRAQSDLVNSHIATISQLEPHL